MTQSIASRRSVSICQISGHILGPVFEVPRPGCVEFRVSGFVFVFKGFLRVQRPGGVGFLLGLVGFGP